MCGPLEELLHTFHVTDEGPGKMLIITTPAQFERFVAEVGSPAQAMTLPAPEEPEVKRLIQISAKYDHLSAAAGR